MGRIQRCAACNKAFRVTVGDAPRCVGYEAIRCPHCAEVCGWELSRDAFSTFVLTPEQVSDRRAQYRAGFAAYVMGRNQPVPQAR